MSDETSQPQSPEGGDPGAGRVISSISFDGIECPVVRTQVHETYFAFEPPTGQPTIYTDDLLTNDQLIAFVDQWLPKAKLVMADVQRRFRKSTSPNCRYQTGDVAYVFGRPFLLRVSPQSRGSMRHAARGRANLGVRLVPEVSLIELSVMQTGSYDQRRQAFMSWADGVLARNGAGLFAQAAERAGASFARKNFTVRVREMRDRLVHIDEKTCVVWLSRDLIAFPPMCCAYACAREIAQHGVSPSLSGDERDAALAKMVHAGCPDWELAHATLFDPDSVFRRQ